MRRWCPAVSISSCLSLISILRGNVARLCRLNRCVSQGGKVICFVCFFFPLFGMGSVWVLQCGCVWFQGQKWILQIMPTGWQAGSLKYMLSFSFCSMFASPTLSTHSCITLHYFFSPSFKQTIKEKQWVKYFAAFKQVLKLSKQMVVHFLFVWISRKRFICN